MKQLPVVFLSFLLAAPALAAADDLSMLAAGSRVRAKEASSGRVTAEVVDVLPDALLVRLSPQAPTRRLDLARLERLEVSSGKHGHARTGAIVGFVPGFAFGALVGAAFACVDEGSDCHGLDGALGGGVYLGAITAGVGALVGWAIQTERWVRVPLPPGRAVRLSPSVRPVRGGLAAGITIRF